MGWLIALAVVVGLAALPLGVSAKYDAAGAWLRLIAGPVRITLFPRKKREDKLEKKKEDKSKAVSQETEPSEKKRRLCYQIYSFGENRMGFFV